MVRSFPSWEKKYKEGKLSQALALKDIHSSCCQTRLQLAFQVDRAGQQISFIASIVDHKLSNRSWKDSFRKLHTHWQDIAISVLAESEEQFHFRNV